MTKHEDGGLPGDLPEITAEEARRLKAEHDRLFSESARLGALADLAYARAEITLGVIELRSMVADAEAGLEEARHALARTVAAYDPAAADLERAETELATLDTTAGTLDDQLAAHGRVYALNRVIGPLRQRAEVLTAQAEQAKEDVRAFEEDQVPMARAELERAVSDLLSPPLDDMARLFEVAPGAMRSRVNRVGLALVNGLNMGTPHAAYVTAGLQEFMAATGQLALLQQRWLAYLKRKLDPQTFGQVERAFAPPEPSQFRPDIRRPLPPVPGDPARHLGTDPAKLPPVGSPEAAAMTRAQRPYRGPADWPSYGGVRVPNQG